MQQRDPSVCLSDVTRVCARGALRCVCGVWRVGVLRWCGEFSGTVGTGEPDGAVGGVDEPDDVRIGEPYGGLDVRGC